MNNKPLVSILFPIRNQAEFLCASLTSLISQTYKDLEIIAVDDSSIDISPIIVKRFKKKDNRVKLIKNKKQYGMHISLNRALRKAKGQFIAFMDPQDRSLTTRIQKQLSFLLKNPKVVAVGTNSIAIDEKGRKQGRIILPLSHEEILPTLMAGFSMQFETAMINRELLPKDLLHFEKDTYPFIFSELFVKLLAFGKLANINQPLYHRCESKNKNWHRVKQFPSFLKLFLKATALYDYQPSFKSLFFPLLKQFPSAT